jgi:hypothetical protein
MKLNELLEAKDAPIDTLRKWIKSHCKFYDYYDKPATFPTATTIEGDVLRIDFYIKTIFVSGSKNKANPPVHLDTIPNSLSALHLSDLKIDESYFIDVKNVTILRCEMPPLARLVHVMSTVEKLELMQMKIDGGVLSLFKCPKLKEVVIMDNSSPNKERFAQLSSIMTKHLSSADRDITECMDELIEAGLKEYAKS